MDPFDISNYKLLNVGYCTEEMEGVKTDDGFQFKIMRVAEFLSGTSLKITSNDKDILDKIDCITLSNESGNLIIDKIDVKNIRKLHGKKLDRLLKNPIKYIPTAFFYDRTDVKLPLVQNFYIKVTCHDIDNVKLIKNLIFLSDRRVVHEEDNYLTFDQYDWNDKGEKCWSTRYNRVFDFTTHDIHKTLGKIDYIKDVINRIILCMGLDNCSVESKRYGTCYGFDGIFLDIKNE